MKKTIVLVAILLSVAIALTACNPAEQTAAPAEPEQTATIAEPTATEPPPPSPTPEPTPTPDLRVLQSDARGLAMIAEDLPEDGRYFLEAYRGATSNAVIVNTIAGLLGEEMADIATAYLEETQRLEGFGLSWLRSAPAYAGPIRVYHEVAVFGSVAGAQAEVTKYKPMLLEAMDGTLPMENPPQIGDTTNIFLGDAVDPTTGMPVSVILIEFSYRNIANELGFYGLDGEMTLEGAVAIAETLLARQQTFELTSP